MAEVFDSLGRGSNTPHSPEEIKSLLSSLLTGNVGSAKPFNPEDKKEDKKTDDILKILKEIGADVETDMKNAEDYYKKITDEHKARHSVGATRVASPGNINVASAGDITSLLSQTLKINEALYKDMSKMAIEATTKGSLWVHDPYVEKTIENLGKGNIGHPVAEGMEGFSPAAAEQTAVAAGDIAVGIKNSNIEAVALKATIAGMLTGLLGGADIFQHIFAGTIKDEQVFMQEMRQIAFQTQGIAGDTSALQMAWQKTSKTVATTGKNLTVFQNQYVRNLKTGLNIQSETIGVTKTGLNLSTMIGSNAESTADTFAAWNRMMGLSNIQLADISRGVQEVAKFTGITGDNLLEVVKSSEVYIKQLRDAGTLTSETAKNVISLQASLQKRGIAGDVQDLVSALNSSTHLFKNASAQTKTLLFSAASEAGVIDELQTGMITKSKDAQKSLASGLEKVLSRFTNVGFEGLDKLSPQDLMLVNLNLKSAFGLEANALKLFHDSVIEGSKTLSDKISDINKEMQNVNLTAQERVVLEKNLNSLQKDTGFDVLTKFAEASKNATSMQDAVKKTTDQLGGQGIADLKALGINITDSMSTVKDAATYTAQKLKDAGGKDFTSEIQKALDTGDIKGVREAIDKMNEENQKLGVKSVAGLDPLSQMNQTLNEMNENVRRITSSVMGGFFSVFKGNSLMVAYLAALVATFEGTDMALGGIFNSIKNSSKLFKNFFDRAKQTIISPEEKKNTRLMAKEGVHLASNMESHAGTQGLFGQGKDWVKSKLGPKTNVNEEASIGGKFNFKIPEFKFDDMMKAGSGLLKGALALAVVSSGLVAVAAGIIGISKVILKLTGSTPEEAAKIGFNIAEIIAGLGLIALAVKGAMWAIKLMPSFSSLAGELGMSMLKGAGALLLLTTGFVALAAGIVWISKSILSLTGLDSGKAAQVAKDIATLLGATAVIAGAILVGTVALAILGALVDEIISNPTGWVLGALMVEGAAALMVLTPAMVALASAVAWIARKTMSAIGMDAGEATKAADNIGSLLWSAAKIAGAVLAGVAALVGLGVLSSIALTIVPLMLAGAAALAILTPAITYLSVAIINIAQELSNIMPPNDAGKAADSLSTIISSANKIAWGVLKQVAALSILGTLSLIAPATALLMLGGAGAFMILSAPVVALSLSILSMAKAVSSQYSIKETTAIVKGTEAIINGSSHIADSIIKQSKKLVKLGLLSFMAPFAATTMAAGALAFGLLAVPVMALNLALLGMSKIITSVFPIRKAQEIAYGMRTIIESGSTIMREVQNQEKILKNYGITSFILSPITWVRLWAGGKAFKSIAESVMGFSKDLMESIEIMLDDKQLKEAGPKLNRAAGVFTSIEKLITAISGIKTILTKHHHGWFSGIKDWIGRGGKSEIDIAKNSLKQFTPIFKKLSEIIKSGIFNEIDNFLPQVKIIAAQATKAGNSTDKTINAATQIDLANEKIKKISLVTKTINNVSNMLKSIEGISSYFQTKTSGGLFGWISEQFSGPTDMSKPIDNMLSAFIQLGPRFKEIANVFKKFISDVVDANFDSNPKEMANVANTISAMTRTLSNIVRLTDTISKKIQPLLDGSDANKTQVGEITASTKNFGDWFGGIASLISSGIVEPIKKYLPSSSDLGGINDQMESASALLTKMPQFISSLANEATVLDNYKIPDMKGISTDKFSNFFKNFGDFFSKGIIGPAAMLPAIGDIKDVVATMNVLQSALNEIGEMVGATESVVGKVANAKLEDLDKFSATMRDKIIVPLGKIADIAEIKATTTALQFLALAMDSLAKMLSSLKDAMDMVQSGKFNDESLGNLTATATKSIKHLSKLQDASEKINLNNSSFTEQGASIAANAADNINLNGTLGSAAIPSAIRGNASEPIASVAVQAPPINDVYDTINREQAVAASPANNTGELSRIAAATDEQTKILTMIHEDMEKLIDIMQPVNNTVGIARARGASTSTVNNRPNAMIDYGTWQYSANNGSGRQVMTPMN